MIDIPKLTNLGTQAKTNSPCAAALDAILKLPHPLPTKSFVPPPPRHVDDRHFDLIAATLAGGMIAATGREHTAGEAVKVWRELRVSLQSVSAV